MAAIASEIDLSNTKEIHFLNEFVPQERTELDKEQFLQALRSFPCIWDTSDGNYKNRTMKLNAWNCLSQMFNHEGKYLTYSLKHKHVACSVENSEPIVVEVSYKVYMML